jgi:hypothetical protein
MIHLFFLAFSAVTSISRKLNAANGMMVKVYVCKNQTLRKTNDLHTLHWTLSAESTEKSSWRIFMRLSVSNG